MPADSALALDTFDRLWADALHRHDLRLPPINADISGCRTIEDVIRALEKDRHVMTVFREKGQKIRDFLKPFASFVGLVLDSGAEGAAAVGVPGGKAAFAVFGVLLAATKGVSQAYDALEELLSKLQDFLGRLETYLADPSIISLALRGILVRILAQLLDVLALCSKRFDEKVHRARKYIPKRAEHYIQALFGDTEIQDALAKLDKLTNEEQRRSIAEILVSTKVTTKDVQQVLKGQQNVEEDVTAIREELFAIGIVKWLSPPDFEDRHRIVSKARQSWTGNWFFESRFAAWKDTKSGLFWIHGKPGSGKSVLFSSIVDNLRLENALGYFYFNSKQTVRGLIASLVHQLASHSQKCSNILKQFYAEHRTSLSPPSDDKLFDCLSAMLRTSGRAFILVDALDECPEGRERRELLGILKKIIELDCDQLRLLVTSRPEVDVRKRMEPIATDELSLHEASEQANALARHIAEKLSSDEDYSNWSDSIRAEAQNVLVSKADGMFIWADLQLENLRNCPPINIKKALKTLPTSLYDVYARILMGIKAVDTSLAVRVFQCIAFATRPLTVKELAEVFALDFETEDIGFRPECRVAQPGWQLLSTCSSIIEVATVGSGDDHTLVQFIHFSAQEYLLSVQPPDPVAAYNMNPKAAHITLSTLCLEVLNSPLPFSDLPLADYAVGNWMVHVQPSEVQEAVKTQLSKFFHPHFCFFSRWLEAWIARPQSEYLSAWSYRFDERTTPLYVAVRLGLDFHILNLLCAPGVKIDTPGAPLVHAAVTAGNLEIIRLVLEHGADVNACSSHDWSALHLATSQENPEIVCMLLSRGANVDARAASGWTPLHLAALRGYVDHVRALLERGAVVDACGRDETTSLHLATWNGHVNIVQLLLEQGAALDARKDNGSTPLHIAAEQGHVAVACLLLKHGAAPDARDYDERMPLHVAAQNGRVGVIRLLISRGSLVDARGKHKQTALHVAVWHKHSEVVMLLLECSATVDACEEDGKTPLHYAARGGHADIARLLLVHGASINACDNYGFMPLHSAAQNGAVEVAPLLLEQGASIEDRTQDDWTPMHVAAMSGHANFASFLLEQGTAVDVRNEGMCTPLHLAAFCGHIDVARSLLERGATLDARKKHGRTPLHWAAMGGHVEIVRYFLDSYDASFEARTDSGWTVLHVAASYGHVGVVSLAIQLGADIEWQNYTGQTALLCAAAEGRHEVVRSLLDLGANVSACNHLGFNALDHAAAGGHAATMRLLLERGANIRSENAPHGSCVQIVERASRVGPPQLEMGGRTWRLREGDAQDVAQLLRGTRTAIAQGDAVLRRLRRYRSVGSWGDIWPGVETDDPAAAADAVS